MAINIEFYIWCKLEPRNRRCDCKGPMVNDYCCKVGNGDFCCDNNGIGKLAGKHDRYKI